MEREHKKSLIAIRHSLFVVNFIAILFHVSIQLISTHYIVKRGMAHALLESLAAAPESPVLTFFAASVSYLILVTAMEVRAFYKKDDRTVVIMSIIVQFIAAGLIGRLLGGSYTGFVLVMLVETLFVTNNHREWWLMSVACLLVWLFSRSDLYGSGISQPSIYTYINFLSSGYRHLLLIIRAFLTGLNFVLFLLMTLLIIVNDTQHLQRIEAQMAEASKVNEDLEEYIALTDKIASDNERRRIARDLHDSVGHMLTGISAGIDASIVLLQIDQERAKKQMTVVSKAVRSGIKEVRASLEKMRPEILESKSLHEALMQMIDDYKQLTRLDIVLFDEWQDSRSDTALATTVYRVIQESITNSLRHGHADRVEIDLYENDDARYIIIQDDGQGNDEIAEGYGLNQMRERIEEIGGTISFDGTAGFRTFIEIPFKE